MLFDNIQIVKLCELDFCQILEKPTEITEILSVLKTFYQLLTFFHSLKLCMY